MIKYIYKMIMLEGFVVNSRCRMSDKKWFLILITILFLLQGHL